MKRILRGTMWILLIAIPVSWCERDEAAIANAPVVHLRDAVEVRGTRVWLADLLPSEAPSDMQKVSVAIELCEAPQPGSARILDAEQVAIKLAANAGVLRQLVIPSRIAIRSSGWPIAEATVRVAISKFFRQQGWKSDLPDAARLEWLRPFSATEKPPALQVMALDWDNRQQSVQVRLRCATRAACGSFLVHVVAPAPLGDAWRDWLESGIDMNSPSGQPAADARDSVVLAERGKPATLILDDGGMRISLRVICLQPGVLNQQIRVFDQKTRHVFRAQVVGAGVLHSSL
jgi:hypothetical protein